MLDSDNSQAELRSIFPFCAQCLWWYGGLPVNISFKLFISIIVFIWYVILDINDSQAELCFIFPLYAQYLWWCASLLASISILVVVHLSFGLILNTCSDVPVF